MNHEVAVFLLILLANAIVVVAYLLVNLLRKKKASRSGLFRAIVMLVCPVFGPLFFLFGWICFHAFFHRKVDLEDVVFSKERVMSYNGADVERERNMVPLNDAMSVSDKKSTRQLMMSIVRQNEENALSVIARGLSSDDSEVAHYSASVLQETLDKFRDNTNQKALKVREDRKRENRTPEERLAFIQEVRDLFDELNHMTSQHVVSPREEQAFVELQDGVAGLLEEMDAIRSDEVYQIGSRLLEVSDYPGCWKWCQMAAKQFPDVLPTYKLQLRYYYETGKREEFLSMLGALKQSDIAVDHETLQMIRFFA
ncbi:hypothetical protein [Olsenella porci]|uniref:Uncharacterized protein n=1 Tax=Olsenella porci TaxID=2652279 RepID=A0A6N7XMM3_9ACTN|nr:hypothetical protein [Olsenella porci]MST72498.1 hypothetical protein [Olsenella porci]